MVYSILETWIIEVQQQLASICENSETMVLKVIVNMLPNDGIVVVVLDKRSEKAMNNNNNNKILS